MTSPIVIRCASWGHSALPSGRVHGTSVVSSRADNARSPGRSVSCRQRKSIASSITLSARPSKESGNVTPSAPAVFRFRSRPQESLLDREKISLKCWSRRAVEYPH